MTFAWLVTLSFIGTIPYNGQTGIDRMAKARLVSWLFRRALPRTEPRRG
ncbi:MAG: hypothetical protein AVDCRST_MAG25-2653 [uncultured Rubrobacteraceae bacterium]|uniref:Uncharacterized protein n=1 Tax=uncultured Rubrobacteraceae bacterium TaxID=349277 RepID=A0A6J4RQQ4_9ACTN|nr:MAG: hypothetical protein AVDCRST_MAG25-2653 [uncultured Rubrobacteraceae bacterium]